jgi:hypothetical protein
MTALDLYARLAGYFGETESQDVAAAVHAELADIDPAAYEALFRGITRTRPRAFGPVDVMTIADAAAALRLAGVAVDRTDVRLCPICRTPPLGTRACCTVCGFDLADVSDPAAVREHSAWWASWKAGKAPRFDVRGELAKLAAAHKGAPAAVAVAGTPGQSGATAKTAAMIIQRMSGAVM